MKIYTNNNILPIILFVQFHYYFKYTIFIYNITMYYVFSKGIFI